MKKSLVLAMAMALGVTASAYAANPFSDVPAGHWAYDSINKLAAAGVIEGYGDTTFGGDKLMTRYEMAQIVAKAMAKGANVDKLAAEFAEELDNLGVRVANLEKKADNVKITGQVRYHYADYDDGAAYSRDSQNSSKHASQLRSRIWINGQINDDWTYTGMIENKQDFINNTGDEDTEFQRAYVNGKLGGLNIEAGRSQLFLVDGNLYDTRYDGISASYGKDVKLTAFYGKPTDQAGRGWSWTHLYSAAPARLIKAYFQDYDKVYGANLAAKFGAVSANAGYTVFANGIEGDSQLINNEYVRRYYDMDNKIWNVGVAFDLLKDLKLSADYMKSNQAFEEWVDDDDSWIIGLSYAGAKAAKEGSFGIYAKYYDQGPSTTIAHTMNGEYGYSSFKGYMVGGNYTFAKNIVGSVEYYDLKAAGRYVVNTKYMRTLWSQLVFTF